MAFRNMVLNPGTLWGAGQAPLAVQFLGCVERRICVECCAAERVWL
jgi:hypothetical protein